MLGVPSVKQSLLQDLVSWQLLGELFVTLQFELKDRIPLELFAADCSLYHGIFAIGG